MSAKDQSGFFFEFFTQLLPNLLDRKVSSAQFVILLFTTFSRCFMKMSSTDLNTDSCGIPLVTFLIVKSGHLLLSFVSFFFNQLLILNSPFIFTLDDFVSLSVCIDLLETI